MELEGGRDFQGSVSQAIGEFHVLSRWTPAETIQYVYNGLGLITILPAQPTRQRLPLTANAHYPVGVLLLCPCRAHFVPCLCPLVRAFANRDHWVFLRCDDPNRQHATGYALICSNVLLLVNRQGTRIAVLEVSFATFTILGHHSTSRAALPQYS